MNVLKKNYRIVSPCLKEFSFASKGSQHLWMVIFNDT